MMLQIVGLIIYSLLTLSSLLTALLYYQSVDGIVRIIMIRKYLSLSVFFFTVLALSIFGNFEGLRWASIAAIPYLYFKGGLMIHFIKKK